MRQNYFSAFLKKCGISMLKPSKLYNIDVLKAWDYARTFFRSEKLQIPCTKSDTGTTIIFFEYFGWGIMYVCCVCTMYVCTFT